MVKLTQAIRQLLPKNSLSVFDHFVGLSYVFRGYRNRKLAWDGLKGTFLLTSTEIKCESRKNAVKNAECKCCIWILVTYVTDPLMIWNLVKRTGTTLWSRWSQFRTQIFTFVKVNVKRLTAWNLLFINFSKSSL